MEITINTQEVANELEKSYEQELIQIAIRYNAGVNRFLSKFNSFFSSSCSLYVFFICFLSQLEDRRLFIIEIEPSLLTLTLTLIF